MIEAQASNKPIVSTNVGGVSDVVEDCKTGFLSEPDDEINFAKNLVRLIEDRELRESMGAAGYLNVYDKFSYVRLVSDVKSLYRRLIHEKNKQSKNDINGTVYNIPEILDDQRESITFLICIKIKKL